MDLYDSIFTRKSVRKFSNVALSHEQCAAIMNFSEKLKPLFPGIKSKMMIANPPEIKGLMAIKAPHYLLLYSENKDGYLVNAGFILQQIDLFLSGMGIGSCWLGMIRPKAASVDGLDFTVMLAIGNPQEPVHRKDLSDFNRKALSEISVGTDPRLEAARLAPSASNKQPWYFVCGNGSIDVYRKKPNGLMGAIYDRLTQFDLGIALCHLMLACEKHGTVFDFNHRVPLSSMEGFLPVGIICG